jgi:hypothetical protein
MPKARFDFLGLVKDMRDRVAELRTYCLERIISARQFIYMSGYTVDGSKVQASLREGSWVPTVVSAFGINDSDQHLTFD